MLSLSHPSDPESNVFLVLHRKPNNGHHDKAVGPFYVYPSSACAECQRNRPFSPAQRHVQGTSKRSDHSSLPDYQAHFETMWMWGAPLISRQTQSHAFRNFTKAEQCMNRVFAIRQISMAKMEMMSKFQWLEKECENSLAPSEKYRVGRQLNEGVVLHIIWMLRSDVSVAFVTDMSVFTRD